MKEGNNMNTHSMACVEALKKEKQIRVDGYIGLWSVIDSYNGFILLEHNTYGDETNLLVARAKDFIWKDIKFKNGNIKRLPVFDITDVYETYDDIETALQDFGLK